MELSNLKHDPVGLPDMRHFVAGLFALMDLSVHKHIFCSALQGNTWYELLVWEVEEIVKQEEVLESRELAPQVKTLVEVEAKSLH